MDLQTQLADQIKILGDLQSEVVEQRDALKYPDQMYGSNDCTVPLAVYTAALAAYTQKLAETQAASQVAQAAYQAYYACLYGV